MPEHEENAKRAARLELLGELMDRYEPKTRIEIAPSVGAECGGGICRTCGADEVP